MIYVCLGDKTEGWAKAFLTVLTHLACTSRYESLRLSGRKYLTDMAKADRFGGSAKKSTNVENLEEGVQGDGVAVKAECEGYRSAPLKEDMGVLSRTSEDAVDITVIGLHLSRYAVFPLIIHDVGVE